MAFVIEAFAGVALAFVFVNRRLSLLTRTAAPGFAAIVHRYAFASLVGSDLIAAAADLALPAPIVHAINTLSAALVVALALAMIIAVADVKTLAPSKLTPSA